MSLALAVALAVHAPILTLAEAERTALAHQPQLLQAAANTEAAWARADETRATLLPQLSGTASYERTTANFTQRPGLLPTQVNEMLPTPTSFQTFNFWDFGLTLNQYLWDFKTPFAWVAAKGNARAQAFGERNTRQLVLENVRVAYFNAVAQKALAGVARENLANQDRHLEQIRGFVEAGVRPSIDRAQAETDYANAQVALINAQNGYENAKATLDQAMGVERKTDYDVEEQPFPPVPGEDGPLSALFEEAKKSRPDLRGLAEQVSAQRWTVRQMKGGYGPLFSASTSLTDVGTGLGDLAWNWNVTVNATWNFFDGLLTFSRVKEAQAIRRSLAAQHDALEQQVLLEVTQARLQVLAARQTVEAADKAVASARLQLELAEGRYAQGVGSIIELGDAQLAYTQAAAQRVQATYNLATARAQLLKALGRI